MSFIIEFFDDLLLKYGAWWIVGQAFGIVGIILGFISLQMKSQKRLLLIQCVVAAVFCLHYFLIGAYSGTAVNVVCIVRNVIYGRRVRNGEKGKLIPIIFVLLQCAMCFLTWEAWYSVLVLLGIGINTYCMSFSDPQNVRKSIFVTSPLVLAYDVFAMSIGGIIYESVAIISSAIGVWRYRKNKSEASDDQAVNNA